MHDCLSYLILVSVNNLQCGLWCRIGSSKHGCGTGDEWGILAGFYLENFFREICMGGAHSEREDFAKSARRSRDLK